MNAQLARVGGLATSSLRTAQMAQDNQMARYGVNRPDNPDSNTLGLRNALAIAGAKNGIREAEQDRQMNILTGGFCTGKTETECWRPTGGSVRGQYGIRFTGYCKSVAA